VNIDQVLAPHPVKHLGWIGRRLPLHCTAAGKPILAHLPRAAQDRYLARPLLRFTARTVTNPDLVRRELEGIRARGFALAREEYETELCAAGAPVRDHRGDVVASITVSGPTYRLPPERLLELGEAVRLAAGRISARLGHRPAGAAVLASGQRPGATAPPPGPDQGAAGPGGNGPAAQPRGGGVHKTDERRPPVGLAGPVFGD
jgi:hypothetical protein